MFIFEFLNLFFIFKFMPLLLFLIVNLQIFKLYFLHFKKYNLAFHNPPQNPHRKFPVASLAQGSKLKILHLHPERNVELIYLASVGRRSSSSLS